MPGLACEHAYPIKLILLLVAKMGKLLEKLIPAFQLLLTQFEAVQFCCSAC